MYMCSLSICRVSIFSRRSWNVLCRGNHLSAGFTDMLRQIACCYLTSNTSVIFQVEQWTCCSSDSLISSYLIRRRLSWAPSSFWQQVGKCNRRKRFSASKLSLHCCYLSLSSCCSQQQQTNQQMRSLKCRHSARHPISCCWQSLPSFQAVFCEDSLGSNRSNW